VRVDADRRLASATVEGGAGLLATIVRALDDAGVQLDDLGLHRPTLDDVFLALTGRAAEHGDKHTEEDPNDRSEKEVA
jgi:ABC-2 type transport system ATP-binding protein